MKPIFHTWPALLLLLTACSSTGKDYNTSGLRKLRVTKIFVSDSVTAFKTGLPDENRKAAAYYHDMATGFLKSRDTAQGLHYLKRSITLFPQSSYYLELGQVLKETKHYDEASECYVTVSEIEPDVISASALKDMIRTSMLGDRYAYRLLGLAESKGINQVDLMKEFQSDPAFASKEMKERVQTILEEPGAEDSLSFDKVKEKFPEAKFPMNISTGEVTNFSYYVDDSPVGYLCRQFLDTSKKSGYCLLDMRARFTVGNNTAFVYAIDSSRLGARKEMRMIYHKLALFSPEGKILDEKIIGCNAGEDVKSYELNQDQITVQNYRRRWRNPFNHQDFDNEVLSTDLLSTEKFRITPEGKIVPAS